MSDGLVDALREAVDAGLRGPATIKRGPEGFQFYGPTGRMWFDGVGTAELKHLMPLCSRTHEILARLAAADRMAEALEAMPAACETLMDELTGKRAADWGIVNDALVNASRALAAYRSLSGGTGEEVERGE